MALIAPPLTSNTRPPFTFSTLDHRRWISARTMVRPGVSFNRTGTTGHQTTAAHTNSKRVSLHVVRAATILEYASDLDSDYGRILLSDVVVKRSRNGFWSRKWNAMDVATAAAIAMLHSLCVFAPFTFNWSALCVAVGLYVVTGLFGISLSYHRNLSHRSFNLPKWLEYIFAYCGVLAGQRDPIFWVSIHRCHHHHSDSDRDPHSPTQGFWYSYVGWILDNDYTAQKRGEYNDVEDLRKQPFYRFLEKTYFLHPTALMVLLYAIGGFPYVVWATGVRSVSLLHASLLGNAICHVWGKKAWNTGDSSTNLGWLALLTFGDSWHNNHHAFQHSARHGLEWWQLDLTWNVIRFLQVIGLATNVKLPTETQKQSMAF